MADQIVAIYLVYHPWCGERHAWDCEVIHFGHQMS